MAGTAQALRDIANLDNVKQNQYRGLMETKADRYKGLFNPRVLMKDDFERLDAIATDADELGWGDYADGQYTSGAPFSLTANTDTILPNDGLNPFSRRFEEPSDIDALGGWLNNGRIRGRDGDALLITTSLKATPTSGTATQFELWYDIGGSVGELYRRITGFPKGSGVERPITFSTLVYTLDTWEANDATVYIRSNGPVNVYDIRHVVARVHSRRWGRVDAAANGLS